MQNENPSRRDRRRESARQRGLRRRSVSLLRLNYALSAQAFKGDFSRKEAQRRLSREVVRRYGRSEAYAMAARLFSVKRTLAIHRSLGGETVVLVGRPAHVETIRRAGLRVEGTRGGTFHVEAFTELPTAPRPDAVIVTVKSFDLGSALAGIGEALPPTSTLLTQNGLGITESGRKSLTRAGWPRPEEFVVRCVHSIPALWVSAGVVRATGDGELLLPEPVGLAAPAIERFRRLLAGAGLPIRLVPSIAREEWRKAIVNAAINPVTALHRVPNGWLSSGPLRDEALVLLSEAREVAAAEGFPFDPAEIEGDLDRVVGATSENRSSMLQDVERGRGTEIEEISGEILRRGEARGLSLPATRKVLGRIRQLPRGRGGGTPQPS